MNAGNDIGEQLRGAREAMGLTVAQAAERLRVDTSVVEALEAGRFAALGVPVFVRGHLRRYAELLGAPVEALQSQYAAMAEASDTPDLTALPRLTEQVLPPSGIRWQLIALLALLVVAAVGWWFLRVRS